MPMDKKEKQLYEEPSLIIITIKMEAGILQSSTRDYNYHSLDED